MERANDTMFNRGPKAADGVGMNSPADKLAFAMMDNAMVKSFVQGPLTANCSLLAAHCFLTEIPHSGLL